jgi:hypothetical protein
VRHFDQRDGVLQLVLQLLPGFGPGFQAGDFLQGAFGFVGVVPEIRGGGFLLQFNNLAFFRIQVKDNL